MAHAHYTLGTYGYKHKPRICNTHCLSTATMVEGTRLSVTLYVYCLSCLIFSASLTCHTCFFLVPHRYSMPLSTFPVLYSTWLIILLFTCTHNLFRFPFSFHTFFTEHVPLLSIFFPYSSHEHPLILQIQWVCGSVYSELTRSPPKWQNDMPLHSAHMYFWVGPCRDNAEKKLSDYECK